MKKQNEDFGKSLNHEKKHFLKLYITGSASRSISAINNLTEICKNNLVDYDLQIFDIYENPTLAKEAQILAIPTLIKVLPFSRRRLIGDMSSADKVLNFLADS
jgi:circadian clock protein KaiB